MRWVNVRKQALAALAATVVVASIVLLPAQAPASSHVITGSCTNGCRWRPQTRRIRRGGRIVWRVPAGDTRHSVTAFRAGGSRRWSKDTDIAPGRRTSHVFRRTGTYRFLCKYHPPMRGYVRVIR